ncbi:hypothetical protein WP5S18E01_13580 [Enterobacter cloacae]|nr:hypothetical protein WP5S18E01_13580 [Enterobacter cloacae]
MQYIILGGDNLIFSYFFPRNKCDPPPILICKMYNILQPK